MNMNNGTGKGNVDSKLMTIKAAGRIQSNEARQSGGQVTKSGFGSRAQRAAAHNETRPKNNP